jgi:hypothetical protein
VDVEPLARMAVIRMVVKATGDGEAVFNRERRRTEENNTTSILDAEHVKKTIYG